MNIQKWLKEQIKIYKERIHNDSYYEEPDYNYNYGYMEALEEVEKKLNYPVYKGGDDEASQNTQKTTRCLVAMNKEGKFFKEEDVGGFPSMTTPKAVDHPYDATKQYPRKESDFQDPKPPSYYFGPRYDEDRKEWLKGFEMVCVDLIIDYNLLKKDGVENGM